MTKQPLATLVVIAYNQEDFIRDAIEGAFSQTYSPLEIILSDDASSDKTFDIITDLSRGYYGPHKIVTNRNARNLGLAGHVNCVLQIASGEIVVFAAGDDISLSHRVAVSVDLLMGDPALKSVSLGLHKFSGTPPVLPVANQEQSALQKFDLCDFLRDYTLHANAPARAIRKEVFSEFGPLNPDCETEDTPLLFRALMLGRIGVYDYTSVLYRVHGKNIWASGHKRFDYRKIYQACADDAAKARDAGYLNTSSLDAVKRSFERRRNRDQLLLDYRMTQNRLDFFVRRILPSRDIPLRGKFRHMVRIVRDLCKS